MTWRPGDAGWEEEGWKWQKSFVDSDSCPDRVTGHQEDMDSYCDENVQTEVIAKCQAARDALATCCRNIGGSFCDELQNDCDIDVCIAATDDLGEMDALIQSEFTDEVVAECEHQGLFGPVPKLLYEFRGDLKETMSGGESKYDLQSGGDAHIDEGALVCGGEDDVVWGTNNIDFTFSAHSMEVLLDFDDVEFGGTITIDRKWDSNGVHTSNGHDSIIIGSQNRWNLGSGNAARSSPDNSGPIETETGVLLHMVAVWDPDTESAKLYRNGEEILNFNPGSFLTADNGEQDGFRMVFCKKRFLSDTNGQFRGRIMFGALYDYALTAQDAEQLYRSSVVEVDGMRLEPVGDELFPGQSVLRGQGLLSVNQRYIAALTKDGMFAIYDLENNNGIFEAEMKSGERATFGDDGNFVIYDANGGKVWHSGSSHKNPQNLVMGDNGRLMAFGADGVFWNSNQHQTVAVSADQRLGLFDAWKLEIGGQDIPLETYILYFCAALLVLNVLCGVMYCYNKRTHQQYKVVSLGSATEDISDVGTDVEEAQFLQ